MSALESRTWPLCLLEDQANIRFSLKRALPSQPEGVQARKRREIEEVSETQSDSMDVRTRSIAIHEAIKAVPDTLDLSNPSTFTTLPFPSPLRPTPRFEIKKINGVDHFEYMGRSRFRELQKRVEDNGSTAGCESLYLYGTSGSGKSHLLAALAFHFIREGKRVFYIPNCRTLLFDPVETVWTALNYAFYDSPGDLGTRIDPRNIDAMISFMKNCQDLYVIVDQVDVLEPAAGNSDVFKERKVQVVKLLAALSSRHRYIFSTSVYGCSSWDANKQRSIDSVFPILGGMNQDETDQWFSRHVHQIPQLSAEQRQRVEYITGRVPLLLRCIINMKDFVEVEFKKIPDLNCIYTDVDKFFREKFYSLSPLSQERYLTMMRECVRGGYSTIKDKNLYDLRYFYIDEKEIGRVTCGIAMEAMMQLLREHDNCQFLDDGWYRAVSRSDNSIVRGFWAEYICLNHIATNGLPAVNDELGRMSIARFKKEPTFTDILSTDDHHTRLYVPIDYNFPTVDGLILMLNRQTKQATMFPIQFTLSSNHKQSDKEFYTKFWRTWSEPITSAGFEVKSTFVWIDKKQPSEHTEGELVKALRSGNKVVHPKYLVVHVGVEMVDSRLASVLGITQ